MTCKSCNDGICTQQCAKGETRPARRRRAAPLADSTRPAMQQFNNTALMLMLQYNSPVVELKQVAHLFGFNTPSEANRAANDGDLPVPVFKHRNSQKAPFLIHVEDLAKHIENQRQQAADEQASWTNRRAA